MEIRYGSFQAIQKLNLRIDDGEFFTFLGPSGCGKTTTLRSLVGFITPYSGEIVLDGKVVNDVPIEKRGIGIVFQSYALFPTMTVYENIAFGLRVKKIPRDDIDRRVREVGAKVALNDAALQRNVAELSGGQQQRVALARAIVLEPTILCLDEPLSNLDAKLRVSLRSELKRLQRELGITMLYVTHDQEEALTMSDRIAVFNNGFVEQVGTPYEIYNKSASEFVCDFIGAINKLEGATLAELSRQTGGKVDDSRHGYIRLERVQLSPIIPHDIELKGKVAALAYNGVMTTYTVELEAPCAGMIRNYQFNNGDALHSEGEEVSVYLSSDCVMQY